MSEHIISTKTYLAVCLALLGLTIVTIGPSYIELGPWNVILALGIAGVKATLIVLYFMHARYSASLTRLALVVAILWLGLLMVGTMDDFLTRGWLAVPGK